MDTKPTYFQLLLNPKWQKKRLEILQAADFECEQCGSNEKTLHVHHTYYEMGRAPWEYPKESLHCLCEECHHKAQELAILLKRQLGKIGIGEHEALCGYALGMEMTGAPETPVEVFSYEVAEGVGAAWELTAEEVITCLREGVVDGETLSALRSAKRGALKEKGLNSRAPGHLKPMIPDAP